MAAFLSPVLIGRCDLNRYIIKSVSEMASTCELNAELIEADMLDRSFDISIIWDEIKRRKREEDIIEKSLMPSETMSRGQTVHQTEKSLMPSETMRRGQTLHQTEKSSMPPETMRRGQTVHQTEKSLMPSETMRRGQMVHQTVSIPQVDFWTWWSVLNVQSKTLTSQKPLTQFAKLFTAATLVLPINQHSFLFELLWLITMMIFFTQDFRSCVVLYLN